MQSIRRERGICQPRNRMSCQEDNLAEFVAVWTVGKRNVQHLCVHSHLMLAKVNRVVIILRFYNSNRFITVEPKKIISLFRAFSGDQISYDYNTTVGDARFHHIGSITILPEWQEWYIVACIFFCHLLFFKNRGETFLICVNDIVYIISFVFSSKVIFSMKNYTLYKWPVTWWVQGCPLRACFYSVGVKMHCLFGCNMNISFWICHDYTSRLFLLLSPKNSDIC